MASSPPAPLHATLPNPKKRPSLVSPHPTTSGGSSYANKRPKRPKLHPLRQTSYPDPNAIPFSATPSARSETGSLISGISSRAGTATGTGEKRRRGRPKKGGKERDSFQGTQDGTQSTGGAGGDREDARTLVSARSGPGGQGSRSVVSARSGDEEDEGEGEGAWATAAVAENLDAADKARKEEEEREENRRLMYVFLSCHLALLWFDVAAATAPSYSGT
jgi:transcription initiation factor TFIID subunit 11